MTTRLDLFATPVITAHLPNFGQVNPVMLDIIRQERARSEGIKRSNIGGWHSEPTMTGWGGEPARALGQFAVDCVTPHMADLSPAGQRDFHWGCDMWANISPRGAANQLHVHVGAFWSGVYYPDIGGDGDDTGHLVLEDPRFPAAYLTVPDLHFRDSAGGAPMRSQHLITPEPGLLVLFPSWLRHSVSPHTGPRDRVSVALNLTLTAAT